MMKGTVIILSIVLPLMAGLLTGCATERYVFPPPPDISNQQPSVKVAQGQVIEEDSFVLQNPHNLSQDEQRGLEQLTEEIDKNPYWYHATGLHLTNMVSM